MVGLSESTDGLILKETAGTKKTPITLKNYKWPVDSQGIIHMLKKMVFLAAKPTMLSEMWVNQFPLNNQERTPWPSFSFFIEQLHHCVHSHLFSKSGTDIMHNAAIDFSVLHSYWPKQLPSDTITIIDEELDDSTSPSFKTVTQMKSRGSVWRYKRLDTTCEHVCYGKVVFVIRHVHRCTLWRALSQAD